MGAEFEHIAKAAEALTAGELVAFPTETVYGIGCNARMDKAVAKVFAVKGRPSFNPLIVHVPDMENAQGLSVFNPIALQMARAFWPGPLTLVLPRARSGGISLLATAGLDTIALRVPAHPLARALLCAANVPVAAPSANRSGRISPTAAAHVREELGDGVLLLDGGTCAVGLESTVIGFINGEPLLLRPGAVTKEVIEAELRMPVHRAEGGNAIVSPGMLTSHYAPSLPIRLNALEAEENEAFLAFGGSAKASGKRMLNLSPSGDVNEAAANLFGYLRSLDSLQFSGIAVMPIPHAGLGAAINDRLKRAAADRV